MLRLLASWFGTGLIVRRFTDSDLGSGTVASIITFPVAVWLGSNWGWQPQMGVAIALVGLGWWVIRSLPDEGDAGWIVIDEASGTLIAVIGLTVWPALAALVVFRLADIFKLFFPGVSAAERLPGATGIMADDIAAGIYGLAAGHIVQMLI